jgi:hypothetical protein
LLGFIGLVFFLGPSTVPNGSQVQRSSAGGTLKSRIVSKLVQRLLYLPAEKLHSFLIVCTVAGILWLLRLATGWESPIEHYITRGPWIPYIFGEERPSLIKDAVWATAFLILFSKTWVSLVGARRDSVGGLCHFASRSIVAFYAMSIFLEYTGLIRLDGWHFNMTLLLALLLGK